MQIEFNKHCINGSVNIPRFNLLTNPEVYLKKDEEYYLVCSKGEVSLSCARILNALGYKCYSINGGIDNISLH